MKKVKSILLALSIVITACFGSVGGLMLKSKALEPESFTVNDIVLYEGIDSVTAIDDNQNEYIFYHLPIDYHHSETSLIKFLLTFEDSSSYSESDGHFGYLDDEITLQINDETYVFTTNCRELQQQEHWTVGNTYEVTAYITEAGWEGESTNNIVTSATFQVTIENNPITNLEVENITIYEGFESLFWGDSYLIRPNCIVTFEDGTQQKNYGPDSLGEMMYEGRYLWLSTNADSMQQEEPWVSGNTYTVTAKVGGFSTDFDVTVKENPIKKIEFTDLTVYDGLDSSIETDWETGESYVYYNNCYWPQFTVTFKDGTQETCDTWLNYDGHTLAFHSNANELQEKEHWTPGNSYTVTAYADGFSGSYSVTVKETPVKSLEVEDLTIYEGLDGSFETDWETEESYTRYYIHPTCKITFEDGTQYTDTNFIEFQGRHLLFETNAESMQREEHWVGGNTYTVTATIAGFSTDFQVKIAENPVASIEVADITLYEGLDSYVNTDWMTGEEYNYYEVNIDDFTVNFKDGTKKKSADSEEGYVEIIPGSYFWLNTNSYEMQQEEHWTVGNTYEVTGNCAGVQTKFNVTIAPNPVESIEIADMTLIDKLDGYTYGGWDDEEEFFYFDVEPTDFTVTLKNGTKLHSDKSGEIFINGRSYELDGTDSDEDQYENHWKVGKTYELTGEFAGIEDKFNVTIAESYKSFTISGKNQLILTFTKKNGQKETYRALRFEEYGAGGDEDGIHSIFGILYTDRKVFNADFEFRNGFKIQIGAMESNILPESNLFNLNSEDEELILNSSAADPNADDEVTCDDAIYLIYHIFKPDDYPVSAEINCDYNGDGEFTTDDAIYLLYHIFLPDKYPV